MTMRLAGTFVLVLGIFVFAGSALAGNGHGNGNGNGSDAAPGNSASAPGQVKKDAPPVPAVTTTTTTATTTTTTTVADQTVAPVEGVKPSSGTAHDTHAPASSNQTKKYGNGQTAGTIAINHGAPPSTVVHGPGNSQPHKAAECSGGHEIDVHALKGRHTAACGSAPPQPDPVPPPTLTPPAPPVVATNPTTPGHTPTTAPGDPGGNQSGEAAGVTVSHPRQTGRSAGVLATTRQAAELPFTGARLWIVVAAGLLLIGAGIALRQIRTVSTAVQSRHDHTDRSRERARGARPTLGGGSGR
jgi:hypothetical protein